MALRVVVCYVTAGAGHRRAAEAIAETIRQRQPSATVSCVDALAFGPRWWRRSYPASYAWLVRYAPRLWAAGFGVCDAGLVARLFGWVRALWNDALSAGLMRWVAEQRPEVVVTTHFYPTDVCARARRRGQLSARVVAVVTDLFPHRFWLTAGTDVVVVATAATREVCLRRGLDAARVHVVGIPIDPAFAQAPARDEAIRVLGLDPRRTTWLIASGGMGLGPMDTLVQRIGRLPAELRARLQLLVVCGDNQSLVARLTARRDALGVPMQVFGFVTTMPLLMRASDVLITKAGGLTVTEALAMGLPMVFCGNIPGQERVNAQHVVEHGAGLSADSADHAIELAAALLTDPTRLAAMRTRAAALGAPDAAQTIVDRFIALRHAETR